MNEAIFVETIPMDILDRSQSNWLATVMDDIFQEEYINRPPYHLFTLGSGVASHMVSLATTPAYPIPTTSQNYLAGRDVFRWGGPTDPHEIDIDRYGITPDITRGSAVLWKAPKTEPHHLSKLPQMRLNIPSDWKEICEAILNGQLF
jgi:hypothetical protein